MSFEKTLNDNDLYAVWAAMCAMTQDIHAPQDTMTDEQTEAADMLWTRLDAEINLRSERSKAIASGPPVLLVDVPAGSICIEAGGQGMALCKWPVPNDVATCSFSPGGPVWYEGTETVTVVATGLSTTSCDWVLTLPEGMTTPRSTALIRRRCAHLMAGGSIESYTEAT
jgi:hypothetical protein